MRAFLGRLMHAVQQSIAWLPVVAMQRRAFLREPQLFATWYNSHRPHCWPRASRCAKPVTLAKGQPGVRLTMEVEFLSGRRHLPVLHLKRAA